VITAGNGKGMTQNRAPLFFEIVLPKSGGTGFQGDGTVEELSSGKKNFP
jgi:hypothetical protein